MTDHPTSFDLSHWSLADLFLFPDGPEIESAFKDLETKIYAFEAYRVRLSDSLSPAEFNQALQQIEAIYRIAYRLNAYAGLWFSEDTQNQSAQTLMARVDQTIASMTNRTLFFSLWWKSVDETQASRLMS
ncbi:MAG TPA: oligoendopeptidase F, partial [Anaerolineaceae bacterium]